MQEVTQHGRAETTPQVFLPEFLFCSPSSVLRAGSRGEPLRIDRACDAERRVETALRVMPPPSQRSSLVVGGALPFDPSGVPVLRLYAGVRREPRGSGARPLEPATMDAAAHMERSATLPTRSSYVAAVARAVALMRSDPTLRRVVLARTLDLILAEPLDHGRLLRRLVEQNPGQYVFHCELAPPRTVRRVLLGASPELLVRKRGLKVSSHPLAAGRPRGGSTAADADAAAQLMSCRSSRREHRLAVESIADALSPFCRDLRVPEAPALVKTPVMWHLGSELSGRLRDPDVSSLTLAVALYPTPAVCGAPCARARHLIAELEGFDRAFFSGAVGYTDARGDGEWAVTLRCAEAGERALRLYAGAGIVAESSPAAKLDETTAKLDTMLHALHLSNLRAP